jgi:hypothetical protein
MKLHMALTVMLLAMPLAGSGSAQVQPPQDRINTAIARAREVGIPVALLESKVAEGRAKGIPLDRIAVAVERRAAALARASEALRGQPDAPASLGVGADAIESGVSDAALRAVAENAPRERRNVAIAVLTQLVQQGHVSEDALARVRTALARGPEALANLPAEAGAGRRPRPAAGAPPAPPAGVPGGRR